MERAHFERSCIRSSIPTNCRYTDLHMPLVEKTPGIDRLKATRVVDAIDGNMPPYHRICEFWFGNYDGLQAAPGSPEKRAGVEGIPNFASGEAATLISEFT